MFYCCLAIICFVLVLSVNTHICFVFLIYVTNSKFSLIRLAIKLFIANNRKYFDFIKFRMPLFHKKFAFLGILEVFTNERPRKLTSQFSFFTMWTIIHCKRSIRVLSRRSWVKRKRTTRKIHCSTKQHRQLTRDTVSGKKIYVKPWN